MKSRANDVPSNLKTNRPKSILKILGNIPIHHNLEREDGTPQKQHRIKEIRIELAHY